VTDLARAIDSVPAFAACGVDVAARWGARSLEHYWPGSLPIARSTSGRVYNWYCALKPLICWSYDEGPEAALLTAHRVHVGADVNAFSYLNASDDQRHQMWRAVLRSPQTTSEIASYQEIATLMLLEQRGGEPIHAAVDRLCATLSLPNTFVRRPNLDPATVGCLIEHSTGRSSLPMMQDRLRTFYDSDHLKYLGGYSTVNDLVRFLAHAVTSHRFAVGPPPSFSRGFMVDLRTWGIDVSDHLSVGHVGFLRTSLLYAEPTTGFVFAGVQRAVLHEGYEALPARWSQLVRVARDSLDPTLRRAPHSLR
jgi:hypothetical protein